MSVLDDDNELVRRRRAKLEALRARGIDPFGGRYPVTHWARPLRERLAHATDDELKAFGPVSLAGRLVALRPLPELRGIEVRRVERTEFVAYALRGTRPTVPAPVLEEWLGKLESLVHAGGGDA